MDQNPYSPPDAPLVTADETNIDALNVSDRWKRYFRGIQKYGGLQLPLFKALPAQERKAAFKEVQPPISSFALAFVFNIFYYLFKGMWKKGLVLSAITLPILIVLSVVLYVIGGEHLAGATRYLWGAIFGFMAPRDFYAFKVQRDNGWLPARPF